MTANVKGSRSRLHQRISIASNDNKGNISMVGGLVNLKYFESIMDNTVKVSANL